VYNDHLSQENSNAFAVFKPIWYLWHSYPLTLSRQNTILLDNSPYTSCMNPKNNGIFLQTISEKDSNTFLSTMLWPYLCLLGKAQNVENFISENQIGTKLITKDAIFGKKFNNMLYNATWRQAPSNFGIVSKSIKVISKMEAISKLIELDDDQLDILKGHSYIKKHSSRGHIIVFSQHLGLPNNGYSEREMTEFITYLKRRYNVLPK